MVEDKTPPIEGRRSYNLREKTKDENKLSQQNGEQTAKDNEYLFSEEDEPLEHMKQSTKVHIQKLLGKKYSFIDNYAIILRKGLKESKPDIFYGVVVSCLSVFIALLYYVYYYDNSPKSFEVNSYKLSPKEEKLQQDIYEFEKYFPSQIEDTWLTFLSGIKSVTRETPNKPSIFLMLYEDSEKIAKCIAEKMTPVAVEFLTGKQNQAVILNGEVLKNSHKFSEDSGELIQEYRSKVKEKHAMIVTELHKVPGRIAKSFHFFCDRETPLVNDAVYFFTLKKSQGSYRNLQQSAENTLKNLWFDSLADNELIPLVTRLTGNIIQIKPESHLYKFC